MEFIDMTEYYTLAVMHHSSHSSGESQVENTKWGYDKFYLGIQLRIVRWIIHNSSLIYKAV